MKKSLVNLFVLVLVFVLMFPCNIVAFANAEPDNSVLANGENITPISTTAPPTSNGMIGKTYIVNTGNYKNLTVKHYDIIHEAHELIRTEDCVFDENNICEIDICYESDFSIYYGSKSLFDFSFNTTKNKYISTKTFTVFNTLEEALNDDGEPVIIETEPSENKAKTKITLKKSNATLYLKGTTQIKASVENGKGITTYKSSDTKVATVNSKGKITAKKAGTAKITVKNNGVKKIFKVTVKKPKLNVTEKKLKVKNSFKLKITGKVGKTTFISSDRKIATVNAKGKVVAKKKGSAVIKVKTNGIILRCKVQVK